MSDTVETPPPDRPVTAADLGAEGTGFLTLSRRLEAENPNRARIGKSPKPAGELARYGQDAHFGIAPSSVGSIGANKKGVMRIRVRFMGLTGPMGALPLHLTEYALHERTYSRQAPFSDFLDLLTDRFVQLFYRAHADADPASNHDRPHDDRFEDKVRALGGVARVDDVQAGAIPRAAFASFAALSGGRRSAGAIRVALQAVLGVPVTVHQFQPHWLRIEPEDQTRLGGLGMANRLGQSVVLGKRVRTVQDTVSVHLGVKDPEQLADFLPGGRRHEMTMDAIRFAMPSHLLWDATLEVPEDRLRPARLDGSSQLGLNGWMKPGQKKRLRTEVRLRPGMGRKRVPTGNKPAMAVGESV